MYYTICSHERVYKLVQKCASVQATGTCKMLRVYVCVFVQQLNTQAQRVRDHDDRDLTFEAGQYTFDDSGLTTAESGKVLGFVWNIYCSHYMHITRT